MSIVIRGPEPDELVAAGAGALARADDLFRTGDEPWCSTFL